MAARLDPGATDRHAAAITGEGGLRPWHLFANTWQERSVHRFRWRGAPVFFIQQNRAANLTVVETPILKRTSERRDLLDCLCCGQIWFHCWGDYQKPEAAEKNSALRLTWFVFSHRSRRSSRKGFRSSVASRPDAIRRTLLAVGTSGQTFPDAA